MKTQRWQITLRLLKRGWTTALESAAAGGHLALSQRMGEINPILHGLVVLRKWVTTASGARVMAYRIVKAPKA